MKRKLTATFVKNAPAPTSKDREIYWDNSLSGFGLLVTRDGHKSWVIQYRAESRTYRITLKGLLSLEEARSKALETLSAAAKGENPASAAKKETTFGEVAENYLRIEGKNIRSAALYRRTLDRLVLPELGKRPIGRIRRSQIVNLIDVIAEEHAVMADLTFAIVRRVFTWHAGRDDHFVSPIVSGMRRSKALGRARARILTDDELRALWKAAQASTGVIGPLLRFLLLTAARHEEAAAMTWAELDGSTWIFPAARSKNKREHVVPLSPAAMSVIDNLPRFADSRYVFTAGGSRPFRAHSDTKTRFDAACGVSGWVIHDLRRTARSLMSRAGVSADVAERCLGHVISGVRGTYDRHAYFDEKRRAFETLASLIARIVNPPTENVVSLVEARK